MYKYHICLGLIKLWTLLVWFVFTVISHEECVLFPGSWVDPPITNELVNREQKVRNVNNDNNLVKYEEPTSLKYTEVTFMFFQ